LADKKTPRLKIGVFDHASLRLGGSQLVIARMCAFLSKKFDVDLIHTGKGYTREGLGKAFEIDLSKITERIIPDSYTSYAIPGPLSLPSFIRAGWRNDRALTERYDFFIYSGLRTPPFSYAKHSIVYCHFPVELRPSLALRDDAQWQKRAALDRWGRLKVYEGLWNLRLRKYAAVLANSRFTAEWIQQTWGHSARVMYPPVNIDAPIMPKKNLIVSIGRFVANDGKNIIQQLNAFPKFRRNVKDKWQLCVIGFCSDSPKDREFVAEIQKCATNTDVILMVNAERTAVLKQLAEAKLFWHTTGLGVNRDEGRDLEHFGISTVEAMMTGCVPLVPGCGGQVEIVEHQVSGYLCSSIEEMIRYSICVADNPKLWADLSKNAIAKSKSFSCEVFERHLGTLVQDYLNVPEL
jgi:glycosyltransferase involved in cell wall biosynthesis